VKGNANGVCKDDIEAAMETNDPQIVANGITGISTASGVAASLIQCGNDNCPDECGSVFGVSSIDSDAGDGGD
jgi:hypothetical protein